MKNTLLISLLSAGLLSSLGAGEATVDPKQTEEQKKAVESKKLLSSSFLDSEKVELGVNSSFRYDSNVDLLSSNTEDSLTLLISPYLRYWLVGTPRTEQQLKFFYNPTVGYSTDDNRVSADHLVSADYVYDAKPFFADWNGTFQHLSGDNTRDFFDEKTAQLLREERRTELNRYVTEAEFEYTYSPLLTLRLNPDFAHYDYRGSLNDYTSGGLNATLFYTFASKRARVGPEFGYHHVVSQNNPEQDAYRGGVRLEWDYSTQTTFYAYMGGEYRDFYGAGSSAEPIGSFGVDWKPDPLFKASLAYNRSISPSASLSNQNYTSDALSVALYKKFLEFYFADLKGSYSWSEYETTRGVSLLNREDHYWSIYADVGREFLEGHAKLSLFYSFTDNDSNVFGGSFDNHATGIQFMWNL